MLQTVANDTAAERKAQWDRFLDAYSLYLRERSLTNAASLRLAASELEETDRNFSVRDFEARLGWDMAEI